MADFEKLIRSAIAARKASTADERYTIYQSSRSALQRLIDTNRAMTVETAVREQRELEAAIVRVEQEFSPPPPAPAQPKQSSEPQHADPYSELKQVLFDDEELDALAKSHAPAAQRGAHEMASPPAPAVQPDAHPSATVAPVHPDHPHRHTDHGPSVTADVKPHDFAADGDHLPHDFAQRRRSQRRFGYTFLVLAILGVLGWAGFLVYQGVQDGTLVNLDAQPKLREQQTASGAKQQSSFITILEPSDLSSLVTANRGEAQIIVAENTEVIRLASIRSGDINQPAQPILLRLQPGVLEQISGKNVTFELFAKSGSGQPAQFTVRCQFYGLGDCGRKRFRVGLQPEASIFAFEFGEVRDLNQRVYIEINTDTTASADTTGRGDVIDIVYARLRPNPQN